MGLGVQVVASPPQPARVRPASAPTEQSNCGSIAGRRQVEKAFLLNKRAHGPAHAKGNEARAQRRSVAASIARLGYTEGPTLVKIDGRLARPKATVGGIDSVIAIAGY